MSLKREDECHLVRATGCLRQQDFRLRNQQHHFPEDTDRFSLGGHMAELGGIYIEFSRSGDGWVLERIIACR